MPEFSFFKLNYLDDSKMVRWQYLVRHNSQIMTFWILITVHKFNQILCQNAYMIHYIATYLNEGHHCCSPPHDFFVWTCHLLAKQQVILAQQVCHVTTLKVYYITLIKHNSSVCTTIARVYCHYCVHVDVSDNYATSFFKIRQMHISMPKGTVYITTYTYTHTFTSKMMSWQTHTVSCTVPIATGIHNTVITSMYMYMCENLHTSFRVIWSCRSLTACSWTSSTSSISVK